MVAFNPEIQPINAPNYGASSRAIDVPDSIKPTGVKNNTINPQGVQQGDLSAQYAGSAAGAGEKASAQGDAAYADLFKDVATTGDFLGKAGVSLVKKDIEDKVYAVADQERQSYTDLLEKIKSGVGVKNVLDAYAGDTPDGEEAQPAEIAGLSDNLATLQGARDSGKISGTYYQSRLLAEAKALRAQYPGFREEIDQQFAKVTGTNPANAYISSLVQDINRANASASSNRNKTLTYMRSNLGSIFTPQDMQAYQAGVMTDNDVFTKAYPVEKFKSDMSNRQLLFNDNKMTREEKQTAAGDDVDFATGQIVNIKVNQLMNTMGINNIADINKMDSLEKAGNIPAKQWQAWGQQAANLKSSLRVQMIADSDTSGRTKALGGKAEALKRIDLALQPMDTLIDRIYNHDSGGLYDVKNQLTAQNDDTKQKMTADPKVGPYLLVQQAAKDMLGEQNLQKFTMETIKGDFNDNFKSWFGNFKNNVATQYNMQNSGTPYTFNDAITNLKSSGINDIKLNKAMFNEVNKITDKTLPEAVRQNYAAAAFSPENRGMIARLNYDGQGSKGGQNSVAQQFMSPEMTKAMFEMGQKNPTIWNNYVDWAKNTIANDLMPREIQDMAKLPDNAGVAIKWDPNNHRFQAIDTMPQADRAASDRMRGTKATDPNSNSYYNTVNSSVQRMNSNIYNFKRIAEASGQDVDSFVLKTIADSAGPEALSRVNGIPHKLMLQIGLGRMGAATQQ